MIVAVIANAHKDPNTPAFDNRSFHPYYPEFHRHGGSGGLRLTADNIDILQEFAD